VFHTHNRVELSPYTFEELSQHPVVIGLELDAIKVQ